MERYTKYNNFLQRYAVPIAPNEIGIYVESGEHLPHPNENVAITPSVNHVFGYAIDRLAELENKIESGQIVEVVRCKECRYVEDEEWCAIHGHKIGDTEYCGYGCRKDDDNGR